MAVLTRRNTCLYRPKSVWLRRRTSSRGSASISTKATVLPPMSQSALRASVPSDVGSGGSVGASVPVPSAVGVIMRTPWLTRPPRRPRCPGRDGTTSPGRSGSRSSGCSRAAPSHGGAAAASACPCGNRSEEHTSELQSLAYLVCRLLLEKKKTHRRHRLLYEHTAG